MTPLKPSLVLKYYSGGFYIGLRLGILDSAITERPISHNFVSSRASWDNLDADLPRYNGYEPNRQ